MLKRDRNHPSVVWWSICNEVGCRQATGEATLQIGGVFRHVVETLDPIARRPVNHTSHKIKMTQRLDSRCVLISDPSTLGAGTKTRLGSSIKKCYPHRMHDCMAFRPVTGAWKNWQDDHKPTNSSSTPLFFNMACKQNLDLRCALISGPTTLGSWAKTRLESRIKKFMPHCICKPDDYNYIS